MAAVTGRALKIYKGTGVSRVLIAGARTGSFTIGNQTVDITDKEDLGWTKLLDEVGSRSVTFEVAGIFKSDALITFALGTTIQDDFEIDVVGFGTLSGKFNITNLTTPGEHDGAAEYNASFASSGVVAWDAE